MQLYKSTSELPGVNMTNDQKRNKGKVCFCGSDNVQSDHTFLCLFVCWSSVWRCLHVPWGRWNILTCLIRLSLRLLHRVCAHLNICNDKYSWFSYWIVALTRTMKHSGHPGKWSWVYSNVPSPSHHHATCTLSCLSPGCNIHKQDILHMKSPHVM